MPNFARSFTELLLIAVASFFFVELAMLLHGFAIQDKQSLIGESNLIATLPVLGRARVGKGRFISEAARLCTGETIEISSNRLLFHTTRIQFYKACGFNLMDTVGYDDSEETTKMTMLQVLKNMQKNDFLPPLVIVKNFLGQSDLRWLNLLEDLFPHYVVAVRGPEPDFYSAVEDLSSSFRPVKIFHLNEYLEDFPNSKKRYADDVQRILNFYKSNLKAGREVRLDVKLFQEGIKRVLVGSEIREEYRYSEEHFEVTETKEFKSTKTMTTKSETCIQADGSLSPTGNVVCTPEEKEEVVDDWEEREVTVLYKRLQRNIDTLKRERVELWKIVANESQFFIGEEYGPWTVVDSRVVSHGPWTISDSQIDKDENKPGYFRSMYNYVTCKKA